MSMKRIVLDSCVHFDVVSEDIENTLMERLLDEVNFKPMSHKVLFSITFCRFHRLIHRAELSPDS